MLLFAHRLVLVLDHLVVRARAGLRQLHLGDELLDDVFPRHVLDGPHPLVDFRRQFHLRRRSRRRLCRLRCGIVPRYVCRRRTSARLRIAGNRLAHFLVLTRCTLLLIDHDRTPFVESASRVQQINLQGNGKRAPAADTTATIRKSGEEQ